MVLIISSLISSFMEKCFNVFLIYDLISALCVFNSILQCTIGFGDYAPESVHARALAVFFVPFSVALMGSILGRIASAVIERNQS